MDTTGVLGKMLRWLPSRTSLAKSAPKVTLKTASGLAAMVAVKVLPASILPKAGHCSLTNSTSGRLALSSSLKLATELWPYS